MPLQEVPKGRPTKQFGHVGIGAGELPSACGSGAVCTQVCPSTDAPVPLSGPPKPAAELREASKVVFQELEGQTAPTCV